MVFVCIVNISGTRRSRSINGGTLNSHTTTSNLKPTLPHIPQMAVKEEGEKAIAQLDGREIDGRPINVRLGTSKPQPRLRKDRTKQSRDDAPSGGGGAASGAGAGTLSSLLEEDD